MRWQKVAGRLLTALVSIAMAVFAATGEVPSWWAAGLGLAVPVLNVVLGGWEPPK